MNTSLRCPLEPLRQGRVEAAGLLLLATLAAIALGLSAVHWGLATLLWSLALLGAVRTQTQLRPVALRRVADHRLLVEYAADDVLGDCLGSRRYGPWLLLDIRDPQGRLQRLRLLPGLLPAEHQRLLGRMLATLRAEAAPSV